MRYILILFALFAVQPQLKAQAKVSQNEDLTISVNGKDVLRYNIKMGGDLPWYADRSFARNGYIHPVWSPAGNVLTAINPEDHLHHYGIWNPWTSVEYDGQMYDLWNIGDKTGTVRFDSLLSVKEGADFCEIEVLHKHIIFQPQKEQVFNTVEGIMRYTPKKEMAIMDEILRIKVWNTGKDYFLWDFTSDLIPSTDLPVILKAYRYAGFGWRATQEWTRENCEMVTSEGYQRPEIDGTHARWVYVTGMSPKGKSGILFMASPENHNFPEPLRIWDQNANGGRGDAFINFAPTKEQDWVLEPGSKYRLQYRMMVFDGDMTPERAEQMWQQYAKPEKINK